MILLCIILSIPMYLITAVLVFIYMEIRTQNHNKCKKSNHVSPFRHIGKI